MPPRYHIAVYGAAAATPPGGTASAAVRIHGVFPTMVAARTAVTALAQEQSDIQNRVRTCA